MTANSTSFKKGHIPWIKGGHHSDKTKEKMSESQMGHPSYTKGKTGIHSKEGLEKLRRLKLGTKLTEAAKENLRQSKIGEKNPMYGRRGELSPSYGKHFNENRIEQMRQIATKLWEDENYRKQNSEAHSGEKNHNWGKRGKLSPAWKGGITPLEQRLRYCFKYRLWRSDVFTRDDFTCQECGHRGAKLNAHHLQSFALILELNDVRTFEQAMACDELWNINNGITFCKECHIKKHQESINEKVLH